MALPPLQIAASAQLACVLEASAAKPGNVCPGRPFRDMDYQDFVLSAVAIGPALGEAGSHPLGVTIERARAATTQWTSANTNLGIILLLAPLAKAASMPGTLAANLPSVLHGTTVADAKAAYAEIRSARPGGMGRAADQDLSSEPTVPLLQAMRLAAERDLVAREWATEFAITLGTGAPALARAREESLSWSDAVVETYLTLLAANPDTLIARKAGIEAARQVSEQARKTLEAGGVRTQAGRDAVARFDAELRDAQNSRNPGTTADLTAAALFVVLVETESLANEGSQRAE